MLNVFKLIAFILKVIMLNVVMLNSFMLIAIMTKCPIAECCYSDCLYAQSHSARWRNGGAPKLNKNRPKKSFFLFQRENNNNK
jgi:hypothetical protein